MTAFGFRGLRQRRQPAIGKCGGGKRRERQGADFASGV